jgi:hypothetical protein
MNKTKQKTKTKRKSKTSQKSNKTKHTFGTILKPNRNIFQTDAKCIPLAHGRSSWLELLF